MNIQLMKLAGFAKEMELVRELKCPFCKLIIDVSTFRDEKSRKEYTISGLCQECQDAIFGKGERQC